ncbi:unnamed protein product, partial [Heterosigma akashiwo]
IEQPDVICLCKIHFHHGLVQPEQEVQRAASMASLVEAVPAMYSVSKRKRENDTPAGFQLVSPAGRIIRTSILKGGGGGVPTHPPPPMANAPGWDPPQNELPDDGVEVGPGEWRCRVCTFVNSGLLGEDGGGAWAPVCSACGS